MQMAGLVLGMSYFGTALTTIMQRNGLKQIELARLSGVDNSNVSRYCTGDQVWVSPDHLEKLTRAISTKAEDRAELIKAHLLDECVGPGSDLIEISILGKDSRPSEAAVPYQVPLPANLEEALGTIREHLIHDRHVRDIIEGLANLLKHGDPRTNEERGEIDIRAMADEIADEAAEKIRAERSSSEHPSTPPQSGSASPGSPNPAPTAKPPRGSSLGAVSYRRPSKRRDKSSENK